MPIIFIVILILVFGVILGWMFSKKAKSDGSNLIEKQAAVKAENKQKIVRLLETKMRITNDEIQKALGVSDATATRYLDELEKERELKQVGGGGRGVYYEK